MQGIQGAVAVVTGAAQGNGRAIALGLAAAGAKVACCDVQGDAVRELAARDHRRRRAGHRPDAGRHRPRLLRGGGAGGCRRPWERGDSGQ
ncbi:SDR family NAD(P)-dependent oxidoreductase [Pararhodobacter zhoushanensis]|uniref:SDR family NAD(P)-dependent oxidoreductase n=1 Tax=Pararhodobacter zhoushanensis TaxID=2479545 RepID=UPI003873C9F5